MLRALSRVVYPDILAAWLELLTNVIIAGLPVAVDLNVAWSKQLMPLPIAVTGMTREKTKAMMRLRTPRMSAPRCSAGCKEAGRLLGIVSAPIIQPGSARIAMGEEGQRGFHLMLRVMPPSQTLLQWHRSINAHRKPKGYERWTSQILADRAKTRCVRSRREPIFAIFSALLSPRGREISGCDCGFLRTPAVPSGGSG